MYIKIYFGDKPLFLCDEIDETIQPFVHHDDAIFIDELNLHTVKAMIHEMELAKIHAGVFYHPDLEELKKVFFKKFTIILAGGGVVFNQDMELLLIFRRGKWDLPKGKLDKGERIEDCALREVEEETGLSGVKLIAPFATSHHTYHEGARFILKESHWFRMSGDGNQKLVPQLSEEIHEIKWVNSNDLDKYLSSSYPSVSDILRAIANKEKIA